MDFARFPEFRGTINDSFMQQHMRQHTLAWPEGGGGGGPGGTIAPPPNNAFSDFCRYIWKFVGTCKPTSMSFVPIKYLMYRQNIERNSSLRM